MSSNSNNRDNSNRYPRKGNNQHGHDDGRYRRNQSSVHMNERNSNRYNHEHRSNEYGSSNFNHNNRRNDEFRSWYNGSRYYQSNHHHYNYHQNNELSIGNNSFNRHSVNHKQNVNNYYRGTKANDKSANDKSATSSVVSKHSSVNVAQNNASVAIATSTISSSTTSTKKVPSSVILNENSSTTSTINASNWNEYSIIQQFRSQVDDKQVFNDYSFYQYLFKDTEKIRVLKEEAANFAFQSTVQALNRIYPPDSNVDRYVDNGFSDEDSCASDDYMLPRPKGGENDWPYPRVYIKKFIDALTYNIRLDHGFFLQSLHDGAQYIGACTLPFVSDLKKWRDNFDLGDSFVGQDKVKGNKLINANSMIQALLAKCKTECEGCGVLSLATLYYLTKLHSIPNIQLKKANKSKYYCNFSMTF